MRPHDIEVARSGGGADSIVATVDHISFAGPFVNVQLTRSDTKQAIEATLSRERYRELELKNTDQVWVKLKNPRVFADDYSI